MINPYGKFNSIWGNLTLVFIGYVAIVTPFKLAFTENDDYPLWDIGEYMIDFFFLIDLILTFFNPIFIKFQLIESH